MAAQPTRAPGAGSRQAQSASSPALPGSARGGAGRARGLPSSSEEFLPRPLLEAGSSLSKPKASPTSPSSAPSVKRWPSLAPRRSLPRGVAAAQLVSKGPGSPDPPATRRNTSLTPNTTTGLATSAACARRPAGTAATTPGVRRGVEGRGRTACASGSGAISGP